MMDDIKFLWDELRKNYSELCTELAVPILEMRNEKKREKILDLTRKVRSNIIKMGILLGINNNFIGGRKND